MKMMLSGGGEGGRAGDRELSKESWPRPPEAPGFKLFWNTHDQVVVVNMQITVFKRWIGSQKRIELSLIVITIPSILDLSQEIR